MGGGAWPILVGGVTCLINFDNGRDPCDVTSHLYRVDFCKFVGRHASSMRKKGEIRSVMPLDAAGGTRVTVKGAFFLFS